MTPLEQHQHEIEQNLQAWQKKPLLQKIYADFYRRILGLIDPRQAGAIVEIGSGIGNLKGHLPQAWSTDLFPNPWLDLVCDGYEMPFRNRTLSHLVLFDVFHHLRAPRAFLGEAKRVLAPDGKLILFEPYISWASYPAYGWFHHEPVALGKNISPADRLPRPRDYYAAQGNATRLFFRNDNPEILNGWRTVHAERFAAFSYLLSGGYSKPALYPEAWIDRLQGMDARLSMWPKIFGARCLVVLRPQVAT